MKISSLKCMVGRVWVVALGLGLLGVAGTALTAKAGTVWLDELDLSKASQDWGAGQAKKSVDQHTLTIGGKTFEHGFGTHAISTLYVELKGGTERFTAMVGVDDEVQKPASSSVEFMVVGDGKSLWKSGVMKGGDAAKAVDLNLAGVKMLVLEVSDADDGISYDHADWADAKFEVSGVAPVTVAAPHEDAVILTPTASAKPRINGPKVFGVRPGHELLFTVPATGEAPIKFTAANLPKELSLDAQTGRITGALSKAGEYVVTVQARNAKGSATEKLRLVCGDKIALTPPMGWNSWNCFANAVDDGKVRAAADALVARGLINHGWSYINIDDCWEDGRDANGRILANSKFPDMKALTAYVHSKGLKIGLYSSPGPKTCAGFEASWQHEKLDAQQYADWGFDYLKYDWCSYDQVQDRSLPDHERFVKPYAVMRAALDGVNRDIVYSFCQYGMGNVWEWGAETGGNCWRTTGDITDTWGSMAGIGFAQNGHEKYAGPGHWNDPDMLVVGRLGWGSLRPTRLTPNEQYTHISLWCLLASPLLIGCDMSQMDDFTVSLLSNDEVLAVNQDALGHGAGRIAKNGECEVWAKDLGDGSKAMGLFNRSEGETTAQVSWADLGVSGKRHVRDLWRQKDLGTFRDAFSATVPRHGVVLVRVW